MKRTKFSRGSDKAEAQAVAAFLAALDGPRQLIRPALETLAKQYGLNYLEILLCLLTEAQDGAAHAQERQLVKLLGPALVFTFRRVTGESPKVQCASCCVSWALCPPRTRRVRQRYSKQEWLIRCRALLIRCRPADRNPGVIME
ncbi:MAG: hypothetical protein IIA10_07775 [Proteobacteria bacterium]|nr:hypothetical protein [Pseudomonadota bacterium]